MSIKEEKRNFFKQKSNEVIFSHLTVNQSTFDFIGISQKSCYLWENVKNDYTEFSWVLFHFQCDIFNELSLINIKKISKRMITKLQQVNGTMV